MNQYLRGTSFKIESMIYFLSLTHLLFKRGSEKYPRLTFRARSNHIYITFSGNQLKDNQSMFMNDAQLII